MGDNRTYDNTVCVRVVEAVDGIDALAKAKVDKFDLVISDVNMPNMDGITLIA